MVGEVIEITVQYDEDVTVTGTPTLALNSGGTADYSLGTGSDTLIFTYTVLAGENSLDLDYTAIGDLGLPGLATIKDALVNDADNTLPVVGTFGGTYAIAIDTTNPSLLSVSIGSNNTFFPTLAKELDTITLSFTSNEAIQNPPVVTFLSGGDATTGSVTITNTGGNNWTATYDVDVADTDGVVTFTIDFTDIAGNLGTTVTSITVGSDVTVDMTAPAILSLTTTAPDPTNTSPIPFTLTFDGDVYGLNLLDIGDITVTNGSASNLSPLFGPEDIYTFDVTPTLPGPVTVTVDIGANSVQDPAGNLNTDTASLSRDFDNDRPTVIISSTVLNPTNVSVYPMMATFSKDVTEFDDNDLDDMDVVVGNGTMSNFFAVSGSIYTFDVTPAGEGAVTVDINAGVAKDAALNTNLVAATFTATYDITSPEITAAVMQDTNGDGMSDRLVLTFDEDLADTVAGSNGLDVASVINHGSCDSETVDPGDIDALIPDIVNLDFACTTAYTAVGDLTLNVTSDPGLTDAAGNQVDSVSLTGVSAPAITDGAVPMVVSTVPADGAVSVLEDADAVVNFSEPMDTVTFGILDDDSNNYTGIVWTNGNQTATLTHDAWTFTHTINASTDAKDLMGVSAGPYNWSFTTWDGPNRGQINVPAALGVLDAGTDLSTGVSAAGGGNILIDNVLQALNAVTSGDLAADDLTGAEPVGDVTVTPLKAVTLNSTGPISLTNAGLPSVEVLIPNNTTLFGGATWDGMLYLKAGTTTGNAPTGFSVGGTTFEVGSTGGALLLDQPATITLTGITGPVAFKPSGSVNWFTIPTCAGTYAAPVNPAAPTHFLDCAISDGTDTKIITYHFSVFGPLVAVVAAGTTTTPSVAGGRPHVKETDSLHGAAEIPYIDISGHWAESYIGEAYLYLKGYTDENNEEIFKPDENITRNEVAMAIALKLSNDPVKCKVDPFLDITVENADCEYIDYLKRHKILQGYADGNFYPDKEISRAEAVKVILIAKVLQYTSIKDVVNPFTDVKTSDWFYNYVMVAYKLSVIQGYDDGTFGPGNSITRAEFAKIFTETLL
jgi:hypothetical protein